MSRESVAVEGVETDEDKNTSRKVTSTAVETTGTTAVTAVGESTSPKSYTLATAKLLEHSAVVASDKKRHGSSGASSTNGGDTTSNGSDPKTESSSEEVKGEGVDDSSNGVSPEISQTLEWDYGQDFDGKIPNTMSGSASTGTSESLSDVLRDGDNSEHSDGIEPELPSGATEDSLDQFETPDNDFESIDNLEDFPIFGKNPQAIMTDSGISDKDFESNMMAKSSTSTICGNSSGDDCSREDESTSLVTAKAHGSDSSQETIAAELALDTPVSTEEKAFPGSDGVAMERRDVDYNSTMVDSASPSSEETPSVIEAASVPKATSGSTHYSVHTDGPLASDVNVDGSVGLRLGADAMSDLDAESRVGGGKKERPISLLSTASGDTGNRPLLTFHQTLLSTFVSFFCMVESTAP